jgi:thioredoxin reductase (NADPH)
MVKHIYKKGTEHGKIEHYDVLILGGGPAGLVAALYASRYNLKTAIIAKSFGGTMNLAGKVENWPGFVGSGAELGKKFKKHAEKFGARFLEADVNRVTKDENGFVFEVDEREIHGKTLIVTLGTEHRKLNVPGEKEFLGKGVSYCVTCDANFFKGKNVAVVGGADSAAKAAIYLSGIAKKVHVIYRRGEMRCEPISLKKIKNTKNIEIHYFANPTQIMGNKKVEAIEIEQTADGKTKKTKIDVDGVFAEIGATPVNEIVRELGLKMIGDYIITDKDAKTNVEGVFAAGDNTNNKLKQIITAASEGAVAAYGAFQYLEGKE